MAEGHVLLLPYVFPPESHRLRRESHGAESLPCLPNLLGNKFRDKSLWREERGGWQGNHLICHFAKIVLGWLSAAQKDSGLTATEGTSVVR